MKNKVVKRIAIALLSTAVLAGGLTGCGKSTSDAVESAGDTANETESAEDDVTVIKVGTGTGYPTLWYEDDNGYLTGYCVEVLRAINDKLPQYEFEYETSSDLTGVLISLDAKKVQIGEYLFNKNPEREEKYLFGNEAYFHSKSYIGALADRDDLNSIEDFEGKVVGVVQGDSFTTALEKYNEEHPGHEIILEYITWGTDEENLSLLTSGRVDGLCDISATTVASWKAAYGNGNDVIKIVGEPVIDDASYLIFNKDNTELQEATDAALRELLEDGTLSELSVQFMGNDYSK